MHLVGYLYEEYHDARSLEHKALISDMTKLIVAIRNFANAPKQRVTMHSAGLFTSPYTTNCIALNL